MSRTIGRFVRTWLKRTETFVYDEVTNIKRFNKIIFTREIKNLNLFPIKNIFASLKELDSFEKNWSKIEYNLIRKSSYFEKKYFLNKIKEHDVKLIHTNFGPDGRYFLDVAKKANIPLITTFHGYDASRFLNEYWGLGKIYIKQLLEKGDLFLTVSEDIRKRLIKNFGHENKIKNLHLGIDINKFKFKKRKINNKIEFCMVCGFTLTKDVIGLIKAFNIARKTEPKMVLNLIGDGPSKRKTINLAHSLKLNDCIKFKDFLSHSVLAKELYKNNIFIYPCVTSKKGAIEGMPTSIMEAMATGMPIISTWHGGIPELIKHGKNGYLVKENDIRGLAEKMIYLANNPDLILKFGVQARKDIEKNFDLKTQVKKLENIYEELI